MQKKDLPVSGLGMHHGRPKMKNLFFCLFLLTSANKIILRHVASNAVVFLPCYLSLSTNKWHNVSCSLIITGRQCDQQGNGDNVNAMH